MSRLEPVTRKIMEGTVFERWLAVASFGQKTLVFTNGCFDILHRGHVQYLAEAASLGDYLIIGLNTDDSVKRLKGPNRPYLDQETRAMILASMGFVSAVVLFDEETPYRLIQTVKPHFLVKGGDYKAEDIVGYDIVTSKGGQVVTIPLVSGFSSTNIIQKIAANNG
jgi:D-glycero-beta-D-manno-heptose 1-phosphate adenylyltransferase